MRNKIDLLKENFELVISVILLALLATCLDPIMIRMPELWNSLVVYLIVAAFGIYAGILFREKNLDERERLHSAMADRGGFLAGTALLVASIVVSAAGWTWDKSHIWILSGMILTKLFLLVIARIRN
ncbi:hypothetical protein [Spirochaeta dissipatitropha]